MNEDMMTVSERLGHNHLDDSHEEHGSHDDNHVCACGGHEGGDHDDNHRGNGHHDHKSSSDSCCGDGGCGDGGCEDGGYGDSHAQSPSSSGHMDHSCSCAHDSVSKPDVLDTFEAHKTGHIPAKGVYYVHTLGCQMNAHDSERIAGVLEDDGYVAASQSQIDNHDFDLIVLNTCAVRENATERMYGTLGHWAQLKRDKPELQIAVGGCMAQKDRQRITERAPWVDAVFGTKNIGSLTTLLDQAKATHTPQVEVATELEYFPSQLPTARAGKVSAWVSISVGCNNTCTFCIVPAVRGKERDRRPGDILDEVNQCVARGVKEITFLGQNVNSYGYAMGDRFAFAKLLRACADIEGLKRVRFTSPHPAAFTDDVIVAMASTPNVMPQLHMPLQSGSDAVLRAMRRSYRREKFMTIVDKVRTAMPDAQITTDIIVGFPGETEEDFEQTVQVVRDVRFTSAYIFEYSPRPGTPAALLEQIDPAVVHSRFERLHAVQEEISREIMAEYVGREVEVMITDVHGRKDGATHRISGRERGGNLVHIGVPEGFDKPRMGDIVRCTVTASGAHYLISDPDPSQSHIFEVSE